MGMMYGNGSFKGGIDAAVLAYIGNSTLTTSADNLGDAINEHEEDISEIKSNLSQLDGLTVYKNLTPQTSYADFDDGSTLPLISLTSNIEPIQDLHGYDNPWAGGAGKNKLPLTVESIKTASDKSTWNNNSITINGVTYEIQVDTDGNVSGIKTNGTASGDSNLRIYDGGAEFHGKLLNGCPSNGSLNTYYLQLSNVSTGSDFDLGNGTVINQTDTGRWILIINIKNGTTVSNLVFYPMIRLASESDATFAPYSNICPISGFTEANVSVSGVNVWDGLTEIGSINTTTGENTPSYNQSYRRSDYIKIDATKTYYCYSQNNMQLVVYEYDENHNYIGFNVKTNVEYTPSSNCAYIRLRIDVGSGDQNPVVASINYPSTDTDYEPYNGQTYNVEFKDGSNPLTVYGGTLDVLNGLLTVTHVMVDLGNGKWEQNSYVTSAYNLVVSGIKKGKLNEKSNILCEALATAITVTATALPNLSVMVANGAPIIVARDDNYISNPTDFKTAMNGVQLVYELATPITYQLTPTQVNSLLGQNYIFSDTGNITNVKYIGVLNFS